MNETKGGQFDVVVIGSGSAGFAAAQRARELGARVCIVEEGAWGGECPNYACVPTKALLKSAHAYYELAKHAKEFGVRASSVRVDFASMMVRKRHIVDTITGHGKRLPALADRNGIETIRGRAVFLNAHEVRIGTRTIRARRFIIATGVVDAVPTVEGIRTIPYLTYKDVVQLTHQPKRVVIIGAGPVGCEMATFFAMIGTRVTLIQLAPHVLVREDEELSAIAEEQLKLLGVDVHTATKALSVELAGKSKRVTFQREARRRDSVLVDEIVVAAGKRPNVIGLHLERAGVKMGRNGWIAVKETLQTSQKHIFIAGDVSGGYMFTHAAHEEGILAAENALARTMKMMHKRDFSVLPRVTFVYPELASVGVTAKEAKKSGKSILVGKFPVGALTRAVTEGHRVGLVKIVADKRTRRILGGHIIADRAGEMIHEIALAMKLSAKIDDLAGMIHAFPTYSEAVSAAASMTDG